MTSIEQVAEFCRAFGHPIADRPNIGDPQLNHLRFSLIREEARELMDALDCRDPVSALDALCDLEYVLMGAWLTLGFSRYRDAAMAEVHRSNMSKLGEDGKPIYRQDGKILKGPHYSPPDLAKVVADVDGKPS